jgi:hypothetical protein
VDGYQERTDDDDAAEPDSEQEDGVHAVTSGRGERFMAYLIY